MTRSMNSLTNVFEQRQKSLLKLWEKVYYGKSTTAIHMEWEVEYGIKNPINSALHPVVLRLLSGQREQIRQWVGWTYVDG